MRGFFNRRATVGAVALALGGVWSLPAWAEAQMEEVVVTGSYIKERLSRGCGITHRCH